MVLLPRKPTASPLRGLSQGLLKDPSRCHRTCHGMCCFPPYGRARPAPGATWSMMSNALDAAMRAACSLKFGIPFRMYPPAFIDRAHAAHPKDDFSALMPVGPPRQSGEKLPAAESMSS